MPGLIIHMKDSKNDYNFKLISLTKDSITNLNYLSKKYITVTETQLRKISIDHYNDPYREIKIGKKQAAFFDENGNTTTLDYRSLTIEEQEYIRIVNNPIELSTAIKYPN